MSQYAGPKCGGPGCDQSGICALCIHKQAVQIAMPLLSKRGSLATCGMHWQCGSHQGHQGKIARFLKHPRAHTAATCYHHTHVTFVCERALCSRHNRVDRTRAHPRPNPAVHKFVASLACCDIIVCVINVCCAVRGQFEGWLGSYRRTHSTGHQQSPASRLTPFWQGGPAPGRSSHVA